MTDVRSIIYVVGLILVLSGCAAMAADRTIIAVVLFLTGLVICASCLWGKDSV